jgi:hypothetical protein
MPWESQKDRNKKVYYHSEMPQWEKWILIFQKMAQNIEVAWEINYMGLGVMTGDDGGGNDTHGNGCQLHTQNNLWENIVH